MVVVVAPRLSLILLSSLRCNFAAFNMSMDFLAKDSSEWENDASFQSSQQVICSITGVNDFAERGVALNEDYSKILTKDYEQRQYLLQAVE